MKNIHILPTETKSRLHYYGGLNRQYALSKEPLNWRTASNLYITSSEEIKRHDYYIRNNNKVSQSAGGEQKKGDYRNCKKVILSTDPTLIADGVQEIPKKFLEWFVKNPTCEKVKIESWETKGEWNLDYKIIIPQKEPKQICENCKQTISKYGCACGGQKEEPKQEKEEEYFKHLEKDKKEFAEEWEEIRQEFGFGKQEPKQSKVYSENGNELFFDKQGNLIKEIVGEKVMPLDNENIHEEVTLEEAFKRTYLGERVSFNSDIGKSFELGVNYQTERMFSEKVITDIANKVLTEEYSDFPANAWHYEREFRMLVKAMTLLTNH
jgi:hypothetical protein